MLDKKTMVEGPINLKKSAHIDFLESLLRVEQMFEENEDIEVKERFESCLKRAIKLELEKKNRSRCHSLEELTEREKIKTITSEIDF